MSRIALLAAALAGWFCVPCFGQEDGKVYQIRNKLTGKVLAPDGDGARLVQETLDRKNQKQHWLLVAQKDHHFMIINAPAGKALTIPSKEPRAQIGLEALGDGGKPRVGQLWAFEATENRFLIRSRRSDLYLDVFESGKEDGVKVIQQTLNGKNGRGNQVWELHPVK